MTSAVRTAFGHALPSTGWSKARDSTAEVGCQRSRRSPSQVRTRRRHPSLTAPAIPVRRYRVRVRGCSVMIHEGALETARSLDTHVIRPSSIDRRNRQDDRQSCDRVEVSLRGDHENRAVIALLSAANRLEGGPGHDPGRELEVSHVAGRRVLRAPTTPTPRRETSGLRPRTPRLPV